MPRKESPTALTTKTTAQNHRSEMTAACQMRRRQPEHVCTAWYGHVKDAFTALATENRTSYTVRGWMFSACSAAAVPAVHACVTKSSVPWASTAKASSGGSSAASARRSAGHASPSESAGRACRSSRLCVRVSQPSKTPCAVSMQMASSSCSSLHSCASEVATGGHTCSAAGGP